MPCYIFCLLNTCLISCCGNHCLITRLIFLLYGKSTQFAGWFSIAIRILVPIKHLKNYNLGIESMSTSRKGVLFFLGPPIFFVNKWATISLNNEKVLWFMTPHKHIPLSKINLATTSTSYITVYLICNIITGSAYIHNYVPYWVLMLYINPLNIQQNQIKGESNSS